ncbi:MAG: glycosyltransferase family 4 protein [bacterium]|nr:glycosyltransferase family 4 protein [bacterium]
MNSPESKPIRIVRVIARLNIGGPAIHVTLLTEKLTTPAYESVLLSGSVGADEGDMAYYAAQHGVTPRILPELGRELNPVRDLITVYKVYRLLRELKPDIVHTHTAKAGFVGRIAAKLAGVPVIVHTFHGHTFRGYFNPLLTRVFILIERFTARLSDTVITLTEGLRRELADEFRIARRSRITVLPLGLDLERFARIPRHEGNFRAQHGIPADAPLIGVVGRLVPVKNHALFLNAAARIRQAMPAARFMLVGDGELRSALEAQIAALGLADAVVITGWIEDVAPIYSDLDLLVISSVNEGTPVTVIEGLAAGLPVVATAVGGLPDLLDQGQFGVLVPSEHVEALADAILKAVRQPPKAAAIAAAQAAMVDRYGIDRLVTDMDSLYRGLLAKKGRRG